MVANTRQNAHDKWTKQLLHYLKLATDPKIGQEAAVVNFAAELLKALSTTMKTGSLSPDVPYFFLSAERTQSPRLTFASWTITKFWCGCRRTRD